MRPTPYKYVQNYLTQHGKRVWYYKPPGGRKIRLSEEAVKRGDFSAVVEALPESHDLTMAYRRRVERIAASKVKSARERSKKKGCECDLTADWAKACVIGQQYRCCLTGIHFSDSRSEDARLNPFALSFDRIDARLGYTQSNVRIVISAINLMMLDWGEPLFRKVVKAYLDRTEDGHSISPTARMVGKL